MQRITYYTFIVFILMLFVIILSCKKDKTEEAPQTVTDIDGNTYKTVKIGNQVWMAENLRTIQFNDGVDIPNITESSDWNYLITPACCWYDNDESTYKNNYGAIYNWYAVNPAGKSICPEGWHIPTDVEFNTLIEYLGSDSIAGGKLKETGTQNWNSPNTEATNESGFTALPGGLRSNVGLFYNINFKGTYWSATENDAQTAWYRIVYNNRKDVYKSNYYKTMGASVRCVKN